MGEDVWFLTGTDEHGQKVQKAAAEHNMTPIEQCNSTVVRFQELWRKLGIRNDDFIRTTEERHKEIVRMILQDLYDRDLIYKAQYQGSLLRSLRTVLHGQGSGGGQSPVRLPAADQ